MLVNSNQQAYNHVFRVQKSIDNNPHFSDEQKEEIKKAVVVFQEPVKFQDIINSTYAQVTPELKPILDSIFWTSKTQINVFMKFNDILLKQIASLTHDNQENKKILDELKAYKEEIEQQEAKKAERRAIRINRQRRPETQPFEKSYLSHILNHIDSSPEFHNLTKKRLRVAIVILVITGIRISEVRNCQISPIFNLLNKNFIAIDRLKQGRKQHKAFLTPAGINLLKKFREDFFELLFALGVIQINQNFNKIDTKQFENLFLFTSQQSRGLRPLSRQHFTDQVNKVVQKVPELKDQGIRLTSHSFRKGYITELWKETNDIEFVRQIIGHSNIQTTSLYTVSLSDTEKQTRLNAVSC